MAYTDNNGKLSSTKFLQDNLYYQDFSYVLKVNETLDKYKAVVINLLHPAGMKMIGAFYFADLLPEIAMWAVPEDRVNVYAAGVFTPIIRQYAAYRCTTSTSASGLQPGTSEPYNIHPNDDPRFPTITGVETFQTITLKEFVRTRWEL